MIDRFARTIKVGDPIAWGPLVPRVDHKGHLHTVSEHFGLVEAITGRGIKVRVGRRLRLAHLSPSTCCRARVLDLDTWERYRAAGLAGEEVTRG